MTFQHMNTFIQLRPKVYIEYNNCQFYLHSERYKLNRLDSCTMSKRRQFKYELLKSYNQPQTDEDFICLDCLYRHCSQIGLLNYHHWNCRYVRSIIININWQNLIDWLKLFLHYLSMYSFKFKKLKASLLAQRWNLWKMW